MRLRSFIVAAALLVPAPVLAAPDGGSLDVRPHQAAVEVDAGPELGLGFSYGYRFRDVLGRTQITPSATFGFPVAGVADGRSFDAELGANWIVPLWKWLGLTAGASTFLASARTPAADLVGWGISLSALPGFYHDQGFAALSVAWRPTISTRVRHRARSRGTFTERYPDDPGAGGGPLDGWYAPAAHILRLGVAGGWTIRRRVTIFVGGGMQLQPGALGIVMYPDVGILPFYGRGGVAVHL